MQKKSQKGLLRSFGLGMAIIIVMSSIIGSGVFKKVAPMSAELGSSSWVVIAWVLSGLIVLCGVLSIAELAALYPQSGGPFMWLEKIYGKMLSFLYGWACFTVIQSAAIASVAFIFAGAVNTFVPLPHFSSEIEGISVFGVYFFNNIGAKVVTSALIIGLTITNIRGAKKGGLISLISTFTIVLCFAFILGAAFGSGAGSWETFNQPSSSVSAKNLGVLGFITALVIAIRHSFWAFEGWIALGFIGDEIKKPRVNLPKAMAYGILIIMVLYVIINTAYLYVAPINDIVRDMHLDENNIAAVLVIDKIFGDGGAYIISGMILISTFGCTNATTLVSARVYYAMARTGWFFKSVGEAHPRYRTPHRSLIYQCVWACLLTFSGSFDLLTDLVIIAAYIFYGLVVFGVIVLRIKNPTLKRPYKTFAYPIVPLVFTLFCLLLLVVTLIAEPAKSLVGLALVLSGLPFYYYWRKKNKNVEKYDEGMVPFE